MKRVVGLDARMWKHPGIGRYIRELSAAMLSCERSFVIRFFSDKGFRAWLSAAGRDDKVEFEATHSAIYGLREQVEMQKLSASCDLMHVPHFNVPVFSRTKLVVTVHDLIYLDPPSSLKERVRKAYVSWLLKNISKRASCVIAVSCATRDELLRCFHGLNADRVRVIYEAAASLFFKITDHAKLADYRERAGLTKPFVLFVGGLKPHKNLPVLIEAMDRLVESRPGYELVLVGKKDSGSGHLLRLIASKSRWIRYLEETEDADLLMLYNLAEALVLPSLKEGFGLPVVEAMSCGTPVVVSNRSSLPELIGKDAGILFDPGRVEDLVVALENILQDRPTKERLSSAALERAKRFSWKKAAQETIAVYEELLEGRSV